MEKQKTGRYRLSTRDLLTMAVLAVVGGIICSYVWPAFMNIATPIFGFLGPVGWIAVSGVYMIFPAIVGLLIAKPGAVTLYAIIQGFVEMLFGNPFGAMAMVYSGLEGLGFDIGMALFKWKPILIAALIGGGIGSLIVDEVYIFLFGMQSTYTVTVGGITAFISGAVLGGLIALLIVKALERTGVITRIGYTAYEKIEE